jgi:Heat shock protein. Metallo peptidase. MEROPS family M48B
MTVASFVAMIASMIMNNFLFASIFSNREQGGAWIIAGIVAAMVWVIATMLMMALSRYREFAADRGSAYITNNPDALISALQKISGKMERLPTQAKVQAEGANAF